LERIQSRLELGATDGATPQMFSDAVRDALFKSVFEVCFGKVSLGAVAIRHEWISLMGTLVISNKSGKVTKTHRDQSRITTQSRWVVS
jgi:hypothetical protein